MSISVTDGLTARSALSAGTQNNTGLAAPGERGEPTVVPVAHRCGVVFIKAFEPKRRQRSSPSCLLIANFPGARWFPGPGAESALEDCPWKLPIYCADTDAIVAIIKHPKTATPATMTDPATILPPLRVGDSGAAREAKVCRT